MSEDRWDAVLRQQKEAGATEHERELYRLKQQQISRQHEIARERQKQIRQEEYEDNVHKREMARGSHINLAVTDDDLLIAYQKAVPILHTMLNQLGSTFSILTTPSSKQLHDAEALKDFLSKGAKYLHERYANDKKFEKAQELELGGALYALIGGHLKVTFAFKGYNPNSWVIKEFGWGVGVGLKGKLLGDFRPEVKKEIEPNASLYDKEKIGNIDGLEAKAEATNSKAEASMSYKNDKEQQPDDTASAGVGVEGSAMFSVSVGRIGAETGVKGEYRTGVYSTYSGNLNHKKGTYQEGGIKAVIAIGLEDKDKDKLAAFRRLGAKVDLGVKGDIFEQTYKFE